MSHPSSHPHTRTQVCYSADVHTSFLRGGEWSRPLKFDHIHTTSLDLGPQVFPKTEKLKEEAFTCGRWKVPDTGLDARRVEQGCMFSADPTAGSSRHLRVGGGPDCGGPRGGDPQDHRGGGWASRPAGPDSQPGPGGGEAEARWGPSLVLHVLIHWFIYRWALGPRHRSGDLHKPTWPPVQQGPRPGFPWDTALPPDCPPQAGGGWPCPGC